MLKQKSERKITVAAWAAAATMTLSAGLAYAQTKTWVGGTSSNWADGANWAPAGAPTATSDVVIPSTAGTITINSNGPGGNYWEVRSLILAATLSIDTRNLYVYGGGVTLNSGTINLSDSNCCTNFGLVLTGTQTVGGTGTINFISANANPSVYATSNANVTIGSGITIRTTISTGLIATDSISTMQINGTVRSSAARLTVQGNISNFDGATQTLNGGTWFLDGSDIYIGDAIPNGNAMLQIGTDTTVRFRAGFINEGNSSRLNFPTLNTNRGTIILENGRDIVFAPAGSLFQNFGTITMGAGSQVQIDIPGSAVAEYRNRNTGVLNLSISGPGQNAQQSRVLTDGLIRLDGTVNVAFVGGFEPDCLPTSSGIFVLAQGGTKSGAFATANIAWPSGTNGTVLYSSTSQAELYTTETPFGFCVSPNVCDDLDFNNDGNTDPTDVDAYFSRLGEGPCL